MTTHPTAGGRTEMLPEARKAIEIADKYLTHAPMARRVALANDILAMFDEHLTVAIEEIIEDGIRRAALTKTGGAK